MISVYLEKRNFILWNH